MVSEQKRSTHGLALRNAYCAQCHSSGKVYTEKETLKHKRIIQARKKKKRSNQRDLKPKMWYLGEDRFPVVSYSTETGQTSFAPCCIMLCQEMSQPAPNNPYGLSLSFSSTSLPIFCLDLSSPPPCCLRTGVRIIGRSGRKNSDEEKVKVRVSSFGHRIEHDVHLCALYFAELPFMLIDFQMMLGMNQWDTASTRNASPSEESCS